MIKKLLIDSMTSFLQLRTVLLKFDDNDHVEDNVTGNDIATKFCFDYRSEQSIVPCPIILVILPPTFQKS